MPSDNETPAAAALRAAAAIQCLLPGDLAGLRRMRDPAGAPAFWRLAARSPANIGRPDKQEEWMAIVRILATLTPKGEPEKRTRLHNSKRKLGAVLCDGGDPDPSWTGRPVFGERRLIQLMSARGKQRAKLLERAARFLEPGARLNVPDIAYALLNPNKARLLAEPYYRRLDRAERAAKRTEEGAS